jgi:hypothetical protein
MEFRWVAAIALWTILSGPIFNGKGSLSAPSPDRARGQESGARSQESERGQKGSRLSLRAQNPARNLK